MGVINIDGLPVAAALSGAELLECEQSGVNSQITAKTLTALNSGGVLITPSGDTTGATDFAAIQAVLTAAGSSTNASSRYINFQTGVYFINQKLVFQSNNSSLNGFSGTDVLQVIGLGQVQLVQVTSNTGILEFQCAEGGSNQFININVQGIWFRYQSQQTSANTASVCIGFRDITSPPVTVVGVFNVYIDRCKFQNAYRGIANTQPAGKFAISDVLVSRCYAYGLAGAFFTNLAPTSIGCPNIELDQVLIQASLSGGSEPLINIGACDNFSARNVEMLNIINQPCYNINNSNFHLISCKAEACQWDYSGSGTTFTLGPIVANNSSGTINGYDLLGVKIVTLTGAPPVILTCSTQNSGGSRSITISGLTASIGGGTTAGAKLTMVNTVNGCQVVFLAPPSVTTVGVGSMRLLDSSTGTQFRTAMVYPPGGGISGDMGDANVTFGGWDAVGNTDMPTTLIFNTQLTANRTVTLPTAAASADNYWDNLIVRVIRTVNAAGAFTLTVNGTIPATKTIAIGASATFAYSTLGWVEIDSGAL